MMSSVAPCAPPSPLPESDNLNIRAIRWIMSESIQTFWTMKEAWNILLQSLMLKCYLRSAWRRSSLHFLVRKNRRTTLVVLNSSVISVFCFELLTVRLLLKEVGDFFRRKKKTGAVWRIRCCLNVKERFLRWSIKYPGVRNPSPGVSRVLRACGVRYHAFYINGPQGPEISQPWSWWSCLRVLPPLQTTFTHKWG